MVQVLEGENAVSVYRGIMGATNPADAENGTIRKLLQSQLRLIHGSDSDENAAIEISHFLRKVKL